MLTNVFSFCQTTFLTQFQSFCQLLHKNISLNHLNLYNLPVKTVPSIVYITVVHYQQKELLTLSELYFTMIGRANVEGSKSNDAMNACAVPHASYACGLGIGIEQGREGGSNDAPSSNQLGCYPCLKFVKTTGSSCIQTENQNQVSFYPFVLLEISALLELSLGHLCNHLTDVPPQPNS